MARPDYKYTGPSPLDRKPSASWPDTFGAAVEQLAEKRAKADLDAVKAFNEPGMVKIPVDQAAGLKAAGETVKALIAHADPDGEKYRARLAAQREYQRAYRLRQKAKALAIVERGLGEVK